MPHEITSIQEILDSLGDRDPQKLIITQLGRLASHLASEQRVRNEMFIMLHRHQVMLHGDESDLENHPGLVKRVLDLTYTQRFIGKVLWIVLGAVITLLLNEGWKHFHT
jgi:hypothetical protein